MKRTFKMILAIAGTAAVLGLLLWAAGALMGGQRELNAAGRGLRSGIHIGGEHGINIDEDSIRIGGEHGVNIDEGSIHIGGEDGVNIGEHRDEDSHHSGPSRWTDNMELGAFTELEVGVDLGDLRLETGETYTVTLSALSGDADRYTLHYSNENGKLKIWSEGGRPRFGDMGNWDDLSATVVVTVPKDAELDDVELSTALGDIKVDCAASVKTAELSTNLGDVTCSGLTADELDAESDLGDVTVDLPGERKEYRWECETSLGEIKIDGESRNGKPGANSYSDGIGERTVKVRSSLGDVSLSFS